MEKFSDEQLAGIEVLFKQFDTDSSGKIDFMEFQMLARKMGIEMTDDQLRQSIIKVGETDELELGLQEFVSWLSSVETDGRDPFSMLKAKIKAQGMRPLTNNQITALQECFNTFDTDGSGSIDVEELGNVFSSFGQDLSEDEILSMINDVDADGSGEIEFEEFLLLMMSNFGTAESAGDEVQASLMARDKKKTGTISKDQFEEVMRELCGDALSSKEIAEISAIACEAANPMGRGADIDEKHKNKVEYMKWDSLWEAVQESV